MRSVEGVQPPHVDLREKERVFPSRGADKRVRRERTAEAQRLLREHGSPVTGGIQPASVVRVLQAEIARVYRPGTDGSARSHEVMDALTSLASEHGVTQNKLSGTGERRPDSSDYRAVRKDLHELRSRDSASVTNATLRQLYNQHFGELDREISVLDRTLEEPVRRRRRAQQPGTQELSALIDRKTQELLALRPDFEE